MHKYKAENGRVIWRGVVVAYCYRYGTEKPNSADIRRAKLIAACLNMSARFADNDAIANAETIRSELL